MGQNFQFHFLPTNIGIYVEQQQNLGRDDESVIAASNAAT